MEVVMEMACSVNGIIATESGNEDFLLERNYEIMLELLKEYDVLIWGRKTFDNVVSWGEKYIRALANTNVIILSKNKQNSAFSNVHYCTSLDECLKLCEKKHFHKLFVSGGATINNSFMEKGLVDKIILNYNPYVLNKGIPLFNGYFFEYELELIKVVNEQSGIVQIHYQVIREEEKLKA